MDKKVVPSEQDPDKQYVTNGKKIVNPETPYISLLQCSKQEKAKDEVKEVGES
jgi:hypothetical protein